MTWSANELFGPPPIWELNPERLALVVIDMQYMCAHPDFGLGRLATEKGLGDKYAPFFARVAQISKNIATFLRLFREHRWNMIHVKIAALAFDGRDSSRGHRLRNYLALPGSPEAEILPEVAPQPGEIVLTKTSASAFNSTVIDQVLRNLGVDTLLFSGVVTSGCVELTARDAADRGYQVVIIEDACTAITEAEHRSALERMAASLCPINVRTTADLLDGLEHGPIVGQLHRPPTTL